MHWSDLLSTLNQYCILLFFFTIILNISYIHPAVFDNSVLWVNSRLTPPAVQPTSQTAHGKQTAFLGFYSVLMWWSTLVCLIRLDLVGRYRLTLEGCTQHQADLVHYSHTGQSSLINDVSFWGEGPAIKVNWNGGEGSSSCLMYTYWWRVWGLVDSDVPLPVDRSRQFVCVVVCTHCIQSEVSHQAAL